MNIFYFLFLITFVVQFCHPFRVSKNADVAVQYNNKLSSRMFNLQSSQFSFQLFAKSKRPKLAEELPSPILEFEHGIESSISIAEKSDEVDIDHRASRKESPSKRMKLNEASQPVFVQMVLNNIGLRFGDELVIRNASFTVSSGDKVGLVGPNGAGKVTLV